MKEHDVVVTTTHLEKIPKGVEGTIIHVYGHGTTFVVEFNLNGETIIEDVDYNQIIKI